MSIWPRAPCARRNALPMLSASASAPLPRCAKAPRRCAFRHSNYLRARFATTTTTTRCHKWKDYEEILDVDEDEDDDDSAVNLEAEILEFMRNSSKPEAFPSRKELVDAGRSDLADAIVEKGGWLSLGWDLEEEEDEDDDDDDGEEEEMVASKYQSFDEVGGEEKTHDRSTHKSFLELMDQSSEMGIEGILNRLEKQRSFAFGFEDKFSESSGTIAGEEDQSRFKSSTDTTVAGFFRISRSTSLSPKEFISHDSEDNIDASTNSHQPQMWRSWSIQRAELSEIDINQDIEVTPSEASTDAVIDVTEDEVQEVERSSERNEQSELDLRSEGITHNRIRSRLQHLELELSSVLRAVRSNGDEITLNKNPESLSEDLQKIYDSWEFQENEIMKAQDQLRSTRAKLAVLEGKMALAIIEAQKIMEEKQKRIDDARRALRLLYSTCIVWPNPASEVLLAGSFDGWATLRKMEKSSIGIFSLWLQLYPGRYEIKFIVDGEWRTDPQRPIVNNNGHLNNLLIIS